MPPFTSNIDIGIGITGCIAQTLMFWVESAALPFVLPTRDPLIV